MSLLPKGEVVAPEFGRQWINSSELALAGLRGRVVLIDFWDYTCVNCLRTLPYLVEWDKRYRDTGLVIVGVHTPEFTFARHADLVRAAVERFGIRYPVVLDNDFQIWRAFANQYWPAKYLIDKDGYVRYMHFGEGAYGETESAIQTLLREISPAAQFPALLAPLRDTDQPGAHCYRVTPELYLGYRRGRLGNPGGFQPDKVAHYKLPKELQPDVFFADGPWLARPEYLEGAANNANESSSLLLLYTAKEVNLVLAPHGQPEYRAELKQDGKPLPQADAGADVSLDGQGRSRVEVTEPRMYNLIRNAEFGSHKLEVMTSTPGLGLYAFTFVTCAAD